MVVPIGERALEVERTAARVLVLLRTFRFPAPSPPLWGERAGVRGRSLSTPSSFTQPLTETFFQQRLPIDHEKPPHPNPLPRSGGEGTRQPNVRGAAQPQPNQIQCKVRSAKCKVQSVWH